jgi:uncharacterized protein YggL (DUF469 family)
MKRRLRKKKRIAEFRELGFEVSYRLGENVSQEQADAFLFLFLEEAIEQHELEAGGGGGRPVWDFFVVSARKRNSATDEQREKVGAWLSHRPEVTASEVGPLRDAWHGWD